MSVACAGLAALAVLLLAVPLVSDDGVNPVYLALLALTAIASFEAVQPLAPAFQHLEESRAAGRRIFELTDARPEVTDPIDAAEVPRDMRIEFSNVSFRYEEDGPPALDGVSFEVPPGQRVGIIGAKRGRQVNNRQSAAEVLGIRLRNDPARRPRSASLPRGRHQESDERCAARHPPLQRLDPRQPASRPSRRNGSEIVAACRIAMLEEFIESSP